MSGYLFCGTDGICGGAGAQCITGDQDCFSQLCSDPTGIAQNGTCGPPPSFGVPDEFGCSNSTNCASGFCDTESFLCAAVSVNGGTGAGPTGPSQGARVRARSMNGHNPKDKRKGRLHNFFRKHSCPLGQTACGTARGYEVSSLSCWAVALSSRV